MDPTVLAAFAAGMEWVEAQPEGRAGWYEQAAANAAAARRRLADVPGVEVHDPGGPCTGLIALRLDGIESADAVAHLAERDVLVRPIPDTPFVRVSVGAWTDAADIDALADGLASLPE
jgi:selenocysteine lyase/cysteine desulfurase